MHQDVSTGSAEFLRTTMNYPEELLAPAFRVLINCSAAERFMRFTNGGPAGPVLLETTARVVGMTGPAAGCGAAFWSSS